MDPTTLLLDEALRKLHLSRDELIQRTKDPQWLHSEFDELMETDILYDEYYSELILGADLETLWKTNLLMYTHSPTLLRDKLLMTFTRGFGGKYPEMHFIKIQTTVNERRLPRGVYLNPEAKKLRMYTLDDCEEKKWYDKSLDLMATVILYIDGVPEKRKEKIELSLLLAVDFYREKSIEALDKFIIEPKRQSIVSHFKKNKDMYACK
jgi:hypothetical protein